jgi:2-polyprenyl-3-methyl-5-hydroxy-6-metoxy-1,4-benzoquinol methylase
MITSSDVKDIYDDKYFLEQVDGWKEFADYKGELHQLFPRYRKNIELLHLEKEDSLLEFGCGRGEIVIYHSLRGGKAKGIDFSESAIKLAKAKSHELGADSVFETCSFMDVDEQIKYDKILASEFIEHISKEEGEKFLLKCHRILNPGGILLIYTHPNTLQRKFYNIERLYNLVIKGVRLPESQLDTQCEHFRKFHLNEQNYYSLMMMARRAGFRDVKVFYSDYDVMAKKYATIMKNVTVYLTRNTCLKHLFQTGLTLVAVR